MMFCRHCGSHVFRVGFIAGSGRPVIILICPECDGPAIEDRENR